MLKFYGITGQAGDQAQRYTYKPDLKGMLHAFMVIHDHHEGRREPIFQSIEEALVEHLG